MNVWEYKALLKEIKHAIIAANDRADYKRVSDLKFKKRQLKKRLLKINKK